MNAPTSARVPPKFVPTLTEVVHLEPATPPVETISQTTTADHVSEPAPQSSNESMLYSEFSGQSNPQDVFDQPQAIADDIVFAPSPQPWSRPEAEESMAAQVFHPAREAPQASAPNPASMYDLSPELQEQIVHRVMQRVDLSLEMRLRDAVEAVMLDHTRNLVPRLREEIEWVVRQSVAEAMAAELERGI